MLGTVLTMSQVLNCKTSTEAVSNETAEELNGSLLTEKPAVAAEVPYKITGFSSGRNSSQTASNLGNLSLSHAASASDASASDASASDASASRFSASRFSSLPGYLSRVTFTPSQPPDPVSQTASNLGNLSLSQAVSGLPADDEHSDAPASRFSRRPGYSSRVTFTSSQPQDPVSQTASNLGNLSLSQAVSGLPADDEHSDAPASRFSSLPGYSSRRTFTSSQPPDPVSQTASNLGNLSLSQAVSGLPADDEHSDAPASRFSRRPGYSSRRTFTSSQPPDPVPQTASNLGNLSLSQSASGLPTADEHFDASASRFCRPAYSSFRSRATPSVLSLLYSTSSQPRDSVSQTASDLESSSRCSSGSNSPTGEEHSHGSNFRFPRSAVYSSFRPRAYRQSPSVSAALSFVRTQPRDSAASQAASQAASNPESVSLCNSTSGSPTEEEPLCSASRFSRSSSYSSIRPKGYILLPSVPPLLPFDYEVSRGVYTGPIVNGQPHGKGWCDWPDGAWYGGGWVKGQMEGKGFFSHSDKSHYSGKFKANKPHGSGTVKWPCGRMYKGEWENGVRHGPGKLYDSKRKFVCVEYDKGYIVRHH